MRKRSAAIVAVVVALCAVAALAVARAVAPSAGQSAGDLRLVELGPGLYVYRGLVSNSGVVVRPSGVLVVDTQVSVRAAQQLRERIRAVTPLPVKWVVDTHHHLDHCGGNALFAAEGAEIIASDDTRRLLAERPDEAADWARAFAVPLASAPAPCAAPTRTFSGRLALTLDGMPVELLQLGATETPDGTVVWLPRERALFAGDGVSGVDYPFVGVPTSDDGLHDDNEWTGFLSRVGELKPELLVPGHGPALEGETEAGRRVEQLYDLFEILLAVTRREVNRGTPLLQLIDRVREHVDGFRRRDGFDEVWAGQDLAIFRAWNSVLRRGRGYWGELGPKTLPPADPMRLAAELRDSRRPHGAADPRAVADRALELAARDRSLGLAVLDDALAKRADAPARALLLGTRAAICLEALREARPIQGAEAWFAAGQAAAAEALALDAAQPSALFAQGGARLAGALIFGQPAAPAEETLREALRLGLPEAQEREAHFLLGRAAFVADRPADADRELRAALPPQWRWAFPLVRRRLERLP